MTTSFAPLHVVEPVAANGFASYTWFMIAVPFASAAVLLFLERRCDSQGHLLATATSWASFLIDAPIIAQMPDVDEASCRMTRTLFTWISTGEFSVDFGLLVDPLSMTFVVLVTFVGSLIHVYSIVYMAHDVDRYRFFAYLNFFIAAMLTLVLADSYAVLFVGQEDVDLASYLLISFWDHVPANARTTREAFLMNQVGGMGVFLAIMMMVANFSSVRFSDVNTGVADLPQAQTTLIGMSLPVAVCGKSAQFPPQAWFDGTMAGPTPVSALIHTITMVIAGVHLVTRSGAAYITAPTAASAVVIVDAITLLFGTIVGSAKDGMKKVLTASTMSQIGYVMPSAGLGPIDWAFAVFHLFTHGFFKALIFLGAGSVMHTMNNQVNMCHFSALRTAMKITWASFMMGWLAILGVPPLSGFWSRDKIIEAIFSTHSFGTLNAPWAGWFFSLIALFGAGLTAFYMSQLFFMTFHGTTRWITEAERSGVHPHESSALMTIPMITLTFNAVLTSALMSIGGLFTKRLTPVTGKVGRIEPVLPVLVIQLATLLLVIAGTLIVWRMYGASEVPTAIPTASALTETTCKDLYQDEVNETLFVAPATALAKTASTGDRLIIDGILTGVAAASAGLGRLISATQNGHMRTYASYILGGVILTLTIVLGFRL